MILGVKVRFDGDQLSGEVTVLRGLTSSRGCAGGGIAAALAGCRGSPANLPSLGRLAEAEPCTRCGASLY